MSAAVTTTISLPDLPVTPVILEPRRLLGPPDEGALERRVGMGRPFAIRLRPEKLDRDAAAFVRAEEERASYYLFTLPVSFYPEAQAPLLSADLGILLSQDGAVGEPEPVAWSMSPTQVSSPRRPSTTVTLTARLLFMEAKVSRDIGSEQPEFFLLGLGEGKSDPEWRFRPTSQQPLVGVHRLSLIVWAPAGVRCAADIRIGASVRQRKAHLISYRGVLPPEAAHFTFPN